MSSPRMTSSSRPNISPQQDREVRARAWAFVFDCYRKKEAATSPVSRPGDAERSQSDGASDIIQDAK
jgi:hypothetical protein